MSKFPPDYGTAVSKVRASYIRGREIDRFTAKVLPGNGDECDVWTGTPDKAGYGQFSAAGRATRASTWVLEYELGRRLRPKMGALHTCDNPICVNPDHLYEGDQADNMRDMWVRGRANTYGVQLRARTACSKGHEYTLENTHINKAGKRVCRTCGRIRMAEVRKRGKVVVDVDISA